MIKKMELSKSVASKLIALLSATVLMLTLATGCAAESANTNASSASSSASSESASAAPSEEISVSITVKGAQGDITVDDASDMSVQAGVSALDVLELVSSDVIVEDSEYGPFVTSISGLANEGSSGWMYTVNGEYATESAGEFILSDGDTIEWTYYVA